MDVPEGDKFSNQNDIQMVNLTMKECRQRFGRALKYDPSGENNYTWGMKPITSPMIQFDDENGQPQ